MSIYTHTPGPWAATEQFDGWQIEAPYNNVVAEGIKNGDDMGEADAQLISKAPEMVELLQQLITTVENQNSAWTSDKLALLINDAKQIVFEAIGTLESRGDDSGNARNLADQEGGENE